jgi:drug/metabolite transporter (DMT)-like permease
MALVASSAVWGGTYLVVKDAVARMPVLDFLAWRFAAAAVVLIAARPGATRALDARGLRDGILLGLALAAAFVTQSIGLQHTPAAVSGFLTGLFVVFTPVLSRLLLRRPLTPLVWLGVLLAGAGLGLITVGGFAFSASELLTLGCALMFALQIVGLGEWSPGRDPYILTIVQLATVAVICFAGGFAYGGISVPRGGPDWLAIGVTAVLASAVANTVQTWAQARLSATQTAVILTTEPMFAAVVAMGLGGETLTVPAMAGGVLVVAAMYLVQLPSSRPGRAG